MTHKNQTSLFRMLACVIALLFALPSTAYAAPVAYDIESYHRIEPVQVFDEEAGEYVWVNPGILLPNPEIIDASTDSTYSLASIVSEDTLGEVAQTSTTYYGPGSTYQIAHSLAVGTGVFIIEEDNGYLFVYYNYAGNWYYAYIDEDNVIAADEENFDYPSESNTAQPLITSIDPTTERAVSVNVYAGPGSGYPIIDTLANPSENQREIVKKLKNYGNYTFVEFMYGNTSKRARGFVFIPELISQTFGFAQPITAGKLGWDFKHTPSHLGVDIITNALNPKEIPLYAVNDGTLTMRQIYYLNGDGVQTLVSYGNEVQLSFSFGGNNYVAQYAHLSEFEYGTPIIPKENTECLSASAVNTKWHPIGSQVTVTKGAVIGKSGNTGNSTTPHLHFEMRVNGTKCDPFYYVIFPQL